MGFGGEFTGLDTLALLQQSHRQIGQDRRIVPRKPQSIAQPRFRRLEVRSIQEIQGLEEQRPYLAVAHGGVWQMLPSGQVVSAIIVLALPVEYVARSDAVVLQCMRQTWARLFAGGIRR